MTWKQKAMYIGIGVVLGVVFNRSLRTLPVISSLPEIRVG